MKWNPLSARPRQRSRSKSFRVEFESLESRCLLSTFTVTNTNDSGAGSLREAILNANGNPGADVIDFAIPSGGAQTISPVSALPDITDPLTIDGTTQGGFQGKPIIELDGSNAVSSPFLTNGLRITAGNSTVKGLVINRYSGHGIVLEDQGGNLIQNNFIGTDITGTSALGNGTTGVAVAGLLIVNSSNNTIGGTTAGSGNVISGNKVFGLAISGSGTGNLVEGNLIGTDVTGIGALGNALEGIFVQASNNIIGSTGGGNTIAFNGTGVSVQSGTGNAIQSNSIFSNVGLGIDLGASGVTANDPGDGDTGANDLQNFPILSSITQSQAGTTIHGTLNSVPSTTFTIQFFSNTTIDSTGFGEGEILLDSRTVMTDASGDASFTFMLPGIIRVGRVITATATDPSGNTSEFSQGVQVTGIIVTGKGRSRRGEPRVRVFDAATGAERFNFLAYPAKFHGGVRVAAGDVNGDGVPDIITAPGPKTAPLVQVFDGLTGTLLPGPVGSFLAYSSKFKRGVFVAAGDVDGDGKADIITGTGQGGKPLVNVFSGADGSLLQSFLAFTSSFKGGVFVAAGDVDGDQKADIITGAGFGRAPVVKVFSGVTFTQLAGNIGSFLAYNANFPGGVFVAAGDINGDGKADIITGPAFGGTPTVKVFNGADGSQVFRILAGSASSNAGARVAMVDANGDGLADIVIGAGRGVPPDVHVLNGVTLAELYSFQAFEPTFKDGVLVAGSS